MKPKSSRYGKRVTSVMVRVGPETRPTKTMITRTDSPGGRYAESAISDWGNLATTPAGYTKPRIILTPGGGSTLKSHGATLEKRRAVDSGEGL